ncbi:MarR family winged helix-turn-helix transcriptional regulator [Xylanimonas ulmi]|uniref:DNA-binding MarR family transcriptional regulator n=1 Tax=Xylanimonas ulmi TaxID=228973 RepID=A0A4Q7M730_9MICO|nr:MarR family transcriptional regulator [Xylanibacterium ulmi]RZS62903.1 DNA-binding MarR family transcriptional regulator [Xylanibacterium ulmi]
MITHAPAPPAGSPSPAQPPAEDLYAALEELARAQREAGTHIARRLDWPRAGLGVVRLLSVCGPVQLSDVAAKLRVDTSVASRQVSQLVDGGYVRRTVAADDRRARVLELTEQGEAVLEQMSAQFSDLLAAVFTGWTTTQMGDAAQQIRRVAQAITAAHDSLAEPSREPEHETPHTSPTPRHEEGTY